MTSPFRIGTSADESLWGDGENNFFLGLAGDDYMEGLAGSDTAVYQGNRNEYDVSASYGKFQTLWAFVTDQVEGRDGSYDSLYEVERLQFADGVLAVDVEGNAGIAYQLYQAAFDRKPDMPGLKHQIEAMDDGMNYLTISKNFVESAEFKSLYGENPTDLEFVTALYRNVLQREPEAKGLADHLAGIEQGMSREQLLFNFATSSENKLNLWPDIQDGIWLG
ncbi:DUF4214 domain-containing protein [Teichococcus vastitatis]|uniref:DUF4214 domain-containing protein n=1 Tax=Teichococcus vastitatis TaxID=2307076 RepID=A0ABS9W2P7_9PROT|nr:DUF4214 domain-containing protein [Pseudoroseomonas vastitatis]MCI0753463.1 DUF4214 domain-containing protein [Pseudoroseomonas vastitatis]